MTDKVFIDTNVWVYLYYSEDISKKNIADKLITENFENIIISTQILNELYSALVKKAINTKGKVNDIIIETIANFNVVDISTFDVIKAMEIKDRYGFSYWDSLVIASALESGCSILYSEDMQHNQLIENTLKIINPFKN
ncbi:MAG TPA: PIN domain-containing protein [Clostridiales bacterium]|nr:PIN domain-containing protein [Clostridiales bacterium]HQP69335.1 PIN domain-containing protein [Clostridiales bacterium]